MKRPLDVFLFGGQSNMWGADAVIDPDMITRDLADAGLQTDADRRALFTLGWGASVPPSPWGDIRGHAGYCLGRTEVNGARIKCHGPEVGFVRALDAAGYRHIAIIKVAANFKEYEGGKSPWIAPNAFWTPWRAFVMQRLDELTAMGHPYTIKGFFWHQGIDDGIQGRSRALYEADLTQLIADLRREYGTSGTPFVCARSIDSTLAAGIAGPGAMRAIREGQVAVAESPANAPAAWIDVDDLKPYVNQHHLTAAAQLVAGRRFAEAYLRLLK